ncbi:MAG: hypothetical protein SF172_15910 [Burkholderiales bacterium]|nr:hypothetical protein [Burkholderiales bacterium]
MLLNKLPGHVRAASGLEWIILRKLPGILLGGLLLIGGITGAFHLWPPAGTATEVAKQLLSIDIFAIGMTVVHLTAVGTVAIGCVVVIIMKGPAYVADGFHVSDADAPADADAGVASPADATRVASPHHSQEPDRR